MLLQVTASFPLDEKKLDLCRHLKTDLKEDCFLGVIAKAIEAYESQRSSQCF
jgi:hypothetical protein